jgi:hypothetical protein
MATLERLSQDLKKAQKRQAVLEVSVLRLVMSALNNKQIEKRTKLSKSEPLEKLDSLSQLTEEEVLEVVSSEAKKRRESITEFTKGNRQDLVNKEKEELEILGEYLPKQLSEEEIRDFVKGAVKVTGAKTSAEIGKVMQELMPKVKGRADGSLVNKIVRELLA